MTNEELFAMANDQMKRNPFMMHNYMELESIEPNRAVVRLEIRPESRNPYGQVHGGAIYTLADNATGLATHCFGEGEQRYYVTQSGTLHFLRNQGTGTIRAVAQVRHRGESTVLVDVDILGDNDKLLATGEYTYFRVDLERMRQKRPKD